MGKRLYQITAIASRKAVPGLYFEDKSSAKAKRKELNDSDPEVLSYIVSPGPDHRNFSPTARKS